MSTQQDPNAGDSCVAISSVEVNRCRRRSRVLPVIGAARRWLCLTDKVSFYSDFLDGTIVEIEAVKLVKLSRTVSRKKEKKLEKRVTWYLQSRFCYETRLTITSLLCTV